MPNQDISLIINALPFLVPGIIILYVRSQFTTGYSLNTSSAFVAYTTISLVYIALTSPFIRFETFTRTALEKDIELWFVYIFIGPAIFGLIIGIEVQKQIVRRFLRWLGLNPVHVMPTAWDWKFASNEEQWVLITLDDETVFGGFFGKDSFASSDQSERDLYIQWVYEIDDDNIWTAKGDCGLLIPGRRVKSVNFWPYESDENHG